jgi:glutaredoxin
MRDGGPDGKRMSASNTIRLFNIDGCGYCQIVRETLRKLDVEYEKVDVPWPHHSREEVYEVSGQYTVPVLVDGNVILSDEYEIIDYLKLNYSGKSSILKKA